MAYPHPALPAATVACLSVLIMADAPANAQSDETCLIGTKPPAFGTPPEPDSLHPPTAAATAHTDMHGQAIIGKNTVYWHHLPVFMIHPQSHPHNFQVILEVAFDSEENKTDYRNDRSGNTGLYTVAPQPFDQMMLAADAGDEVAFPAARIFRGHFEQGGTPIMNADFAMKRVIHHREFLLDGDRLEGLHYLLFGQGEDMFLTHLLSAPPDFDQILAVAVEATEMPTEAVGDVMTGLLADGVFLEMPDRDNSESIRLRPGETITCTLDTGTRALPVTVALSIGDEVYCESGEFDEPVTAEFNDPRRCQD